MPTTLTLTGVPDELYARLEQAADLHRRSLDDEAIALLASVLLPRQRTVAERLAEARRLRDGLRGRVFYAKKIDDFKRQGRS